jgi:hypothetical protein
VTVADSVRVVPTATNFEIGTEMAIDETFGFTVTTADADFPPAVAVTVAEPALSAVSVPDDDTVTMVVSLDCQLVVHPPAGAAPAVLKVAVSAPCSPAVRVSVVGAMTTAVTLGGEEVPPGSPTVPAPHAARIIGALSASARHSDRRRRIGRSAPPRGDGIE